jgi:hypothetical protein
VYLANLEKRIVRDDGDDDANDDAEPHRDLKQPYARD